MQFGFASLDVLYTTVFNDYAAPDADGIFFSAYNDTLKFPLRYSSLVGLLAFGDLSENVLESDALDAALQHLRDFTVGSFNFLTFDVPDDSDYYLLEGSARVVDLPAPVPEPTTLLLVAGGIAVVVKRARTEGKARKPQNIC